MSITIEKILAATPGTTRGQPTHISCDSKGERIAYASGKSIFVRSIDNPENAKQYTGHTVQTTVARFAPSGFYIASGDVSGQVRVWDAVECVNTKGEYPIISGRINDIAWDGDSQRIIAVGDGRERFGHCITADSGNSVGEISGHSKVINAVAIRQSRPLRAATVSDDGSMCFLHGAPFKFASKNSDRHQGFVLATAFSPDGSTMATAGADRRIQLYDGKTGEPKGELGGGGAGEKHTGSILALAFSPDSKRLVSASADQTVRAWDVGSGKVSRTWRLGPEDGVASVPDQQVGVAWPANRKDGLIISLSLSGDLNYLVEGSDKPVRVVQGHNKSITAMTTNAAGTGVWTGSFDGRVCRWDLAKGLAEVVDGKTHSNQVTAFAGVGSGSGRTYSVGWDDHLRSVDEAANTFTGSSVALASQPKGLAAAAGGRVVVALADGIAVYKDDKQVGQLTTKDPPTAVAAHGSLVAVGTDKNSVVMYQVDSSSSSLSEVTVIQQPPGPSVTALAFSPDGKSLAVGGSAGRICTYSVGGNWAQLTDRWSAHTARVSSVCWNAAGTHAVSGALDTNVFVWSLAKPGSRVKALNAHKDGVNAVCWVEGSGKVASVGADAAVKIWGVSGLQ